ncbi:MAG: sensor histidine kinase [Actinobacteria bacterium]|nr:sensor histidine kinase [Actinomycetota bacterium]
MRTGAAAGHAGYFHEAAFYRSDDELLDIVVPFLRDGVAAGEPTIVTFAERNAELVRSALPGDCGVRFLAGADQYARPASCIRAYRSLFAREVAAGAGQIRVVGDVPHPGLGMPWHGWARYEAAINHAYDQFPIWGMCPYDTRITPDDVLAEVARTHPHVATPDGVHRRNGDFQDPAAFLAQRAAAPPDPLQARPPALVLRDPSPADARHAVAALAADPPLPAGAPEDLALAVSEVVTNALEHGGRPCSLRAWRNADRVVVVVHDRGPGPADPFAGLMPAAHAGSLDGGFGLWIASLVCDEVAFTTGPDGFTACLVVGRPHVPAPVGG